ncbi:hypothetical protein F5877DRAFT_71913 [Lentinula edodes]|nr:hypothetical protein F5877DRAFT_71913 [Lentinula edodes]
MLRDVRVTQNRATYQFDQQDKAWKWCGTTFQHDIRMLNELVQSNAKSGILDDDFAKDPKRALEVEILKPHPDPPLKLLTPANLALHFPGEQLKVLSSQYPCSGEHPCFADVGEMISHGRTVPYGNETLGYQIPPIVVKLAKQYHSEDLTNKAIMYEGLQCLQGSAIPPCYGFFKFHSVELFDFGPT